MEGWKLAAHACMIVVTGVTVCVVFYYFIQ